MVTYIGCGVERPAQNQLIQGEVDWNVASKRVKTPYPQDEMAGGTRE